MTFESSTRGFLAPEDLDEFARTTVLFELWRPRIRLDRMVVSIRWEAGVEGRYACRLFVGDGVRSFETVAIGTDAYAAVATAASLLRGRFDDGGSSGTAVGEGCLLEVPAALPA